MKPTIENEPAPASPDTDHKSGDLMDEIFNNESGQSSDLTVMERRPKTKSKSILVGLVIIILLAGISAILGFFVFNKSDRSFNQDSVRLDYMGDNIAVSGESVVLRITYKNTERAALTDSEISISYPANFTYISATSSPTGDYHNQWSIGNLQSGEERTLEVSGQLIGEVGSSHAFSAALNFRPANFNSEFSQTIDWEIIINSSTLNVEVKDAQEVIAGQPTTFTIEYTNASTSELDRIKLLPTWPDTFVLGSSDPVVGSDGNWQIGSLKPNEKGIITITGTYNGNPADQQEIKIQAGLVGNAGEFQLQLEKRFLVLIVSQDVKLNLTVGDKTENVAVEWGQTISAKLSLTNASDFQIEKATVSWQYELVTNDEAVSLEMLDWSTLVNPQKADRTDLTLSWSPSNVEPLKIIKPADSVQLAAEVNLVPTMPAGLVGRSNIAIKITPKIEGQRKTGASYSQFTKTGAGYLVKINTKPTLAMEARYYDTNGAAVGSGPFPPIVGQSTTFRVYLSLNNGANDINDASVSLSIPESITWVGRGQVDAGQPLEFDPRTRLVTWKLNKIPAWTGQATDSIMAHFNISVTPVEEQIESYISLIPDANLKGTDAFTWSTINQTVSGIDTSLPNDATGAQRGKVISQGY